MTHRMVLPHPHDKFPIELLLGERSLRIDYPSAVSLGTRGLVAIGAIVEPARAHEAAPSGDGDDIFAQQGFVVVRVGSNELVLDPERAKTFVGNLLESIGAVTVYRHRVRDGQSLADQLTKLTDDHLSELDALLKTATEEDLSGLSNAPRSSFARTFDDDEAAGRAALAEVAVAAGLPADASTAAVRARVAEIRSTVVRVWQGQVGSGDELNRLGAALAVGPETDA